MNLAAAQTVASPESFPRRNFNAPAVLCLEEWAFVKGSEPGASWDRHAAEISSTLVSLSTFSLAGRQ